MFKFKVYSYDDDFNTVSEGAFDTLKEAQKVCKKLSNYTLCAVLEEVKNESKNSLF